MVTIPDPSSRFRAGLRAFAEGRPRSDAPPVSDPDARATWLAGWDLGEETGAQLAEAGEDDADKR
jgi:ribosome modulation factor